MSEKRDLENGTTTETRTLYPMMLENPQLRWSFIRKVYSIITFQLLLTIAVASVVVFVPPIAHFFVSSTQGLVLYIVLIFVPFISMCFVLYI
jgi:FtsH-binding integral membrane protein